MSAEYNSAPLLFWVRRSDDTDAHRLEELCLDAFTAFFALLIGERLKPSCWVFSGMRRRALILSQAVYVALVSSVTIIVDEIMTGGRVGQIYHDTDLPHPFFSECYLYHYGKVINAD
jgi:hypothetical protein